jgi:hypothetical protein
MEPDMKFTLPEYTAAAFAAIMWAALTYLNISLALRQDDPIWQFVGCAFFGIFDICAVMFVPLALMRNAAGLPAQAAAFAILWSGCCAAECFGAYSALKLHSNSTMVPILLAEEQRKAAGADLTREETNLTDIRRLLADERRQTKLEDLHKSETASLKRIADLRPKTFAVAVVSTQDWWAGREAGVVFALWLSCQIAVFGLTGEVHGTLRGSAATVCPAPRTSPGFTITQVRNAPAVLLGAGQDRQQDRQTGEAPKTAGQQAIEDKTEGETDNTPDGPSGGGQPIDKAKKDTVLDQDRAVRERPRLVAVHSETDSLYADKTNSRTLVVTKRPENAPAVLLGAGQDRAGQDAFDQRVSDMKRAGFSVRDIAAKLESTKAKVEAAIKRGKKETTRGRA